MVKKNSTYEMIIYFIIFSIYLGSFLHDATDKTLLSLIQIDKKDLSSHMHTIIQIQASIATLGIALVSILSGFSRDMIFGMPISHYIMERQHFIFTHKRIIFFELLSIILSYITISFNYYNTLVFNFSVSIFFIGIMVKDNYKVFYGSQYMKAEIQEYYLYPFKENKDNSQEMQELYTNIYEDSRYSIQYNNHIRLLDNFKLIELIFGEIDNKNNKSSILWEENYINLCNFLLKNNQIIFILESMCRVFEKNRTKNKVLSFWDKIERNFWDELYNKNINFSNIKLNLHIYKLHLELYNNLYWEQDIKNHQSVTQFSLRIYYCLKNNKNTTLEDKLKLKKSLIDHLEILTYYTFKNDEIKKYIIYNELAQYTKTLIDNKEYNIFQEFFKKILSLKNNEQNHLKYIFTICTYIYYLAYKENLISDEQKKAAVDFIELLKEPIGNLLIMLNLDRENFDKIFADDLKNNLEWWEFIPNKKVKTCFMEMVVNEFLLFYILSSPYISIEYLITNLKILIKDSHFIFYNQFLGKNKEKTIKMYEKFLNLFYKRGNANEEAMKTITIFENALIAIYKINEITKVEEHKIGEQAIDTFIADIKNNIMRKIESKVNIFNYQGSNVNIFNQPILEIETYTIFLENESSYIEIEELVTQKAFEVLLQLFMPKIILEKTNFMDKDALNKFFEQINICGLAINTLLGYRDWFYGVEGQDKFKAFESKMHQVKLDGMNNIILAIDSEAVYFNLIDIDIKIDNLTEKEMFHNIKVEEDKYIYNITNDIFLPFTKDELKRYLSLSKRKIKVRLILEYAFKNECGVGLFFSHEN